MPARFCCSVVMRLVPRLGWMPQSGACGAHTPQGHVRLAASMSPDANVHCESPSSSVLMSWGYVKPYKKPEDTSMMQRARV